jgi:hypothetical protein
MGIRNRTSSSRTRFFFRYFVSFKFRNIWKMKTPRTTYPLRLPRSVKAEVERRARRHGVSINQFVATAVAEELAVINSAEFFAERRNRADYDAFDRILARKGGEKPSEGTRWSEVTEKLSLTPILLRSTSRPDFGRSRHGSV